MHSILSTEQAMVQLRLGAPISCARKHIWAVETATEIPQHATHMLLSKHRMQALGKDFSHGMIALHDISLEGSRKLAYKDSSMQNAAIETPPQELLFLFALLEKAELIPAFFIADTTQADDITEASFNHYDTDFANALEAVTTSKLTLESSNQAEITVFRAPHSTQEHYAITIGKPKQNCLVRIHSSCFTGDVLHSLSCDCHAQLHQALNAMEAAESGVFLYLNQDGRGIGLTNKLRAYSKKLDGLDTVEANHFLGFTDDSRPYAIAATMLKKLGLSKITLMTNNPKKISGLEAHGIAVTRQAHQAEKTVENADYLAVKAKKLGHLED